MKNCRNILEVIFFALFILFISASSSIFNHMYSSFFHYTKTLTQILPPDEPEPLCALVMGTLAIISIILRGAALPFLYNKEKTFPIIHKFLDKISTKRRFRYLIYICALAIDYLVYLKFVHYGPYFALFIFYLMQTNGVIFSFIIYKIWMVFVVDDPDKCVRH